MEKFTSFPDYCEAMRELTTTLTDPRELAEAGQKLQARLVADPNLILEQLSIFIAQGKETIFWPVDLNDLTIYRDKDKLFSVRLFVWEDQVPYPIHDHGSWGIVGSLANLVQETKYNRLDDGSRENYAELEVKSEAILHPGETTYVLPLNDGIHRMQALNHTTALTLHTYGRPIRSGFINGFMRQSNGIYKMYPLAVHRQMLAVKALQEIGTAPARDILGEISRTGVQIVKEAARQALEKTAPVA